MLEQREISTRALPKGPLPYYSSALDSSLSYHQPDLVPSNSPSHTSDCRSLISCWVIATRSEEKVPRETSKLPRSAVQSAAYSTAISETSKASTNGDRGFNPNPRLHVGCYPDSQVTEPGWHRGHSEPIQDRGWHCSDRRVEHYKNAGIVMCSSSDNVGKVNPRAIEWNRMLDVISEKSRKGKIEEKWLYTNQKGHHYNTSTTLRYKLTCESCAEVVPKVHATCPSSAARTCRNFAVSGWIMNSLVRKPYKSAHATDLAFLLKYRVC